MSNAVFIGNSTRVGWQVLYRRRCLSASVVNSILVGCLTCRVPLNTTPERMWTEVQFVALKTVMDEDTAFVDTVLIGVACTLLLVTCINLVIRQGYGDVNAGQAQENFRIPQST